MSQPSKDIIGMNFNCDSPWHMTWTNTYRESVKTILDVKLIHDLDWSHDSFDKQKYKKWTVTKKTLLFEYNIINSFQILNNRPQEVSSINNNQRQASLKIEETVVEDARFPEHGAKEIIIKDGTVTQISGGQYNGFIQVFTHASVIWIDL